MLMIEAFSVDNPADIGSLTLRLKKKKYIYHDRICRDYSIGQSA